MVFFLVNINYQLITGFLFTGIIVGPYFLKFCTFETLTSLNFIEKLSLAFIALAAGSEIFFKEIKSKIKTISFIALSIIIFVYIICGLSSYFLLDHIPFTKNLSFNNKLIISILMSTVLGAISPSSSIAVIKELKARGHYTSLVLGVTIVMDIVVIVLFTINSSIGESILLGHSFDLFLFLKIFLDLTFSVFFGLVYGFLLFFIFSLKMKNDMFKFLIVIILGYLIFVISAYIKTYTFDYLNFEIQIEPLLICIIAGFYVNNFTIHRRELSKLIKSNGILVYISFFTLVGASLEINIFKDIWLITLLLFLARLVSMFFASFTGAIMRKDKFDISSLLWLGFISQAGISLGLAKEAASVFLCGVIILQLL